MSLDGIARWSFEAWQMRRVKMLSQMRLNRMLLALSAGLLVFSVSPLSAQSRLPLCPANQNAFRNMCQGTETVANGDVYVGEFRNDKYHGQGTHTFANGERYVGEFRNDQRHGQGTYTFANGTVYVGEYRDNLRNGQGSLFFGQRSLESGIWRDGIFVGANNLPNPALAVRRAPTDPPPQSSSGTRVRLTRESGTFKVPVRINGVLELQFTVDSGASDVTIPADVVRTLMRTGTIRESDFFGEQTYRLADGSTIRSRTFRIRQLQVGDRTIANVLGSVANVNGSLLLGQSFLERFQRVSFDYVQGVLVLE